MKNILKAVSLLLIVVSLSGCFATQKRCLRLFPPVASTDTVIRVVLHDSIVWKDTTIFVKLPGETFIDSLEIILNAGNDINKVFLSDTLTLETTFARAVAYYKTPRVHLTLFQKGIDLKLKLDSALSEKYYWKDKYTEILNKQVKEVKYIPVLYKVSFWLCIGILAVFLGGIFYRVAIKKIVL
jgi:hypothetical protein